MILPRLSRFLLAISVALLVPMRPSFALMETAAQWIRAGQSSQFTVSQFPSGKYLAVESVARMSSAQLRWQAAAQRVCLSNGNGDLCFDWGAQSVERDGRRLREKIPLLFESDHLFVPVSFVLTKEFSSFSDSDFAWNGKSAVLRQSPRVNLRVPQVEKVDGLYRLAFEVNPASPPQMIEQSSKQIWLRFTRAVTDGTQVYEGDSVISEVRVIQKRHSADLIVKLGANVDESEVYFDNGRHRLVIDIQPEHDVEPAAPAVEPVPAAAAKPVAATSPSPSPVKAAASSPKKIEKKLPIVTARPTVVAPVVSPSVKAEPKKSVAAGKSSSAQRIFVVDAGHGGIDSGAIGVRGTMEKDVNLEVARMLAKELRKQKGVKVIMTRDKDVFVPLSQRTAAANAAGADLFISVHCNSSLSSKTRGFEVYFLSPDATDKAAEAVARVENSVVSLEAQKGAGTSRLEELLASMAVYNFLNESSKFATFVSRNVKSKSSAESAAVKEANFYVLRGAQMPSVLLELEYLSNPVSELQLRSSRFRSQLVRALVDGIMAYDRATRQQREAYAGQPERDMRGTR